MESSLVLGRTACHVAYEVCSVTCEFAATASPWRIVLRNAWSVERRAQSKYGFQHAGYSPECF